MIGELVTGGPRVTTPYPGPAARRLIERMRAVEGAGPRTMGRDDPLVIERATGSSLIDPDGNVFVDLAGSFAASNLGHAHPAVVAAIQAQAERLSHVSSAAISEPRVAFEEALVAIAPAGLDRVLLGMSGADANDTAIRLARSMTGRRDVLAFGGGYFGRSSGVVGLNGKHVHRARTARDADAHFLPFPDAAHWPLGGGEDGTGVGAQALALARHALEDPASGVGPVAAVILEPVQGNGGIVVPAEAGAFLGGLRELCDRTGALLIFDEIQSGFGRTGRLWAGEHWSVTPDLMTVGKGIGGGMALSAVVGRSDAMSHWPAGTHTSTFLGNAVNLAAGVAAIETMRRERLWERSARLGAQTLARLRGDLVDTPQVGEVRGLGLFIGIEIVGGDGAPDGPRASAIKQAAFERGVVVATAGHAEHVLKLSPPLIIDEPVLAAAVEILVTAIKGAP